MRTRVIRAAAGAALLFALAACSGGGSTDEAPAKDSKASKSATSKPQPKPSADKPRALGQTFTFTGSDGVTAAMTVIGYEQGTFKPQTSADEEFGTKGYTWAAVEIKACITKGNSGVTRYPWALAYQDGTRIEPSTATYGDFPKPEYPYEAKIKEGDCVRGKTVFAVPADERPNRVLYTNDELNLPAEWTVPKK